MAMEWYEVLEHPFWELHNAWVDGQKGEQS